MTNTKHFYQGINTLLISSKLEDNKEVEIIGGFMKIAAQLNALRNATSDIWKMHDFNYQLPKDLRQNYWEKECKEHPTSSHCKFY